MSSVVGLDEPMSVREAAAVLGLADSRVRALVAAGRLPGLRVGGRWIVDGYAARDRAASGSRPGRPLSPRVAWALLAGLSSIPVGLPQPEQSRLQARVRRAPVGDPLHWRVWLRERAAVVRYRMPPGEWDALLRDPRLVVGGADGAARGLGLAGGGLHEAYVRAADRHALVRDAGLLSSARPDLVLRVVHGPWPFPAPDRAFAAWAPLPVVAADLADADDDRSRRVGAAELARAARDWAGAPRGV